MTRELEIDPVRDAVIDVAIDPVLLDAKTAEYRRMLRARASR